MSVKETSFNSEIYHGHLVKGSTQYTAHSHGGFHLKSLMSDSVSDRFRRTKTQPQHCVQIKQVHRKHTAELQENINLMGTCKEKAIWD